MHIKSPLSAYPPDKQATEKQESGPDDRWSAFRRLSPAKTRELIKQGIDEILSEDGKTGELRDFVERGLHYTILTHWSSLYSEGHGYGLEGLKCLLERIRKVFGDQVEWKRFEDIDVK